MVSSNKLQIACSVRKTHPTQFSYIQLNNSVAFLHVLWKNKISFLFVFQTLLWPWRWAKASKQEQTRKMTLMFYRSSLNSVRQNVKRFSGGKIPNNLSWNKHSCLKSRALCGTNMRNVNQLDCNWSQNPTFYFQRYWPRMSTTVTGTGMQMCRRKDVIITERSD